MEGLECLQVKIPGEGPDEQFSRWYKSMRTEITAYLWRREVLHVSVDSGQSTRTEMQIEGTHWIYWRECHKGGRVCLDLLNIPGLFSLTCYIWLNFRWYTRFVDGQTEWQMDSFYFTFMPWLKLHQDSFTEGNSSTLTPLTWSTSTLSHLILRTNQT